MPEYDISNKVADTFSSAMLWMFKSFANLNKNAINDLNIPASNNNYKISIYY